MNETLTRLGWALPLVLVLGIGAIFVVRGGLARWGRPDASRAALSLRGSLALSEALQVHLLDVGPQPVLVLESKAGAAVVQLLPAQAAPRRAPWPGDRP